MKNRYRLFLRRKSVYYAFDTVTRKFESLKTKDRPEANRLLIALKRSWQTAGHESQPGQGLSEAF